MKKLKISEIFKGIQGEGFHTGRTAVFVRFAGCNLSCDFCDTKYAREGKGVKSYSWTELAKTVLEELGDCEFVVLTGGEPMIQDADALKLFVYDLKSSGVYVAIETNGTIGFDKKRFFIDWITVSPKNDFFRKSGDELKVLVGDKFDEKDLKRYEQCKFKYFYLQPILPEYFDRFIELGDVQLEYNRVMFMVEQNPKWRMSVQLHKLLGWR